MWYSASDGRLRSILLLCHILGFTALLGTLACPAFSQSPAPGASGSFYWATTPPAPIGSYRHTATLLTDGTVLVVGGRAGYSILRTCIRFIPEAAAGDCHWQYWPSLTGPRERHTTTLLLNGLIVAAGGIKSVPLTTCEIYDPASGTWTQGPNMHDGRYEHTATRLPGNRILVAGSKNYDRGLAGCEILEPLDVAAGPSIFRWRKVGDLAIPRGNHTATLLDDGRVLVTGGVSSYVRISSCEFYTPSTGQWSPAPDLLRERDAHTATKLPDGRVLVVGGDAGGEPLTSCEIFDPTARGGAGEWTNAPSLNYPHMYHKSSLVGDRYIVVTGTWNTGHGSRAAEMLDLENMNAGWRLVAATAVNHANHSATVLADGRILLIGGEIEGNQEATDECEITSEPLTACDDVPGPSVLSLFPDPCQGRTQWTVRLDRERFLRASVMNVLGEVVQTYSASYGAGMVTRSLDVRGMSPGVYFLRIDGLPTLALRRFVVR